MATFADLAGRHTELTPDDLRHLHGLLAEWALLADLAMADLVLWLPVWHGGGFVAGAQVRAATAATQVAEDVVGTVIALGTRPDLERALLTGQVVGLSQWPGCAVPVSRGEQPVAVLSVRWEPQASRAGRLESVYRETAEILLGMVTEGAFPGTEAGTPVAAPPRVGDGLVVLDPDGRVRFASPNAVSACRRLGWATEIVGQPFGQRISALGHRPGLVDEVVQLLASGRSAGTGEIVSPQAVLTIRGVPLRRQGVPAGSLLLLRDVTELRRSERALLGKDAAIREIHHRVKNNLNAVAALLRLQQRRVADEGAAASLAEAGRRVATIALVHETLAQQPGLAVTFDDVLRRLVSLLEPATDPRVDALPDHLWPNWPGVVVRGAVGTLDSGIATPLALVVSELLDNAVRHGQPATEPVEVVVERGPGTLSVVVRDHGPGPGDPATARRPSALGLVIVEALVTEDLQGTVTLRPAPSGRGAWAEVRVPLRGVDDQGPLRAVDEGPLRSGNEGPTGPPPRSVNEA